MNSKQQAITEILNPSIISNRKEAIAKSPKIRDADLIEVPGMNRTWIQFKQGADIQSHMEQFISTVGVAHSGGVSKGGRPSKKEAEEIEANIGY